MLLQNSWLTFVDDIVYNHDTGSVLSRTSLLLCYNVSVLELLQVMFVTAAHF